MLYSMPTTFISITGVTIFLGIIAVGLGLGCLIIGLFDNLLQDKDRTRR